MSTSVSCYRGLLLDPGIYTCFLEPSTGLHIVLKHSTGSQCTDSSPSWGNCRALPGWPGLRCPELTRWQIWLLWFSLLWLAAGHVAFAAETFPNSVCVLGGNAKPLRDQRQAWASPQVGAGCPRLNAPRGAVVADPSQCSSACGGGRGGVLQALQLQCDSRVPPLGQPGQGKSTSDTICCVFLEGCFYTFPDA